MIVSMFAIVVALSFPAANFLMLTPTSKPHAVELHVEDVMHYGLRPGF